MIEKLLKELREIMARLEEYRALDPENRTEENKTQRDKDLNRAKELEIEIQAERDAINLANRMNETINGNPPDLDPNIGMEDREIRQYSLVRAIRAAANGNWSEATLEHEASNEVAKRMKKDPQGFFVPHDWLERRDLVVGTPSAGGDLVEDELRAGSFIDMLRNKMVVQQAGATVLSGLVGNIFIPRQTSGATAYWVTEGNSPTESQQAVDQVELKPKTVGAFTDYSRKLLLQSSIDVENFVRTDLATVLALAIDLATLHGSGTDPEPLGIANTPGIGLVVGGANGANPNWGHIVDLETEVAQDNADIGRLSYITNAKVRGYCKQTDKGTDTGKMLWADNGTPLNGYNAYVTNQVKSDLVKGTSSDCSALFFGNWADLMVGMWGSLDILVDPYTHSTSGTVRVVALQDVDTAIRHAESFAAMVDALTA